MGTETLFRQLFLHQKFGNVKLNNPHKGTEIDHIHETYCFFFYKDVKSNNPHSGPVLISKTHISTKI